MRGPFVLRQPAGVPGRGGTGQDRAAGRDPPHRRGPRLHRLVGARRRDPALRPLQRRTAVAAAGPRVHAPGGGARLPRRLVRHRRPRPRHSRTRRTAGRPAGRVRRSGRRCAPAGPPGVAAGPAHRRRPLGRPGDPALARRARRAPRRDVRPAGDRPPPRRRHRRQRPPPGRRRGRGPALRPAQRPHPGGDGRAHPRHRGRPRRRRVLPRGVGRHRRQPLRESSCSPRSRTANWSRSRPGPPNCAP